MKFQVLFFLKHNENYSRLLSAAVMIGVSTFLSPYPIYGVSDSTSIISSLEIPVCKCCRS